MTTLTYDQLAHLSNPALEEILSRGTAPQLDALPGPEWRGWNIAPLTKLLGIRKFIKGFTRGNRGVEGYNRRVQQNGLNGPWLAFATGSAARRYAFYIVTPVDPSSRDNLYPHALLLDYGASPLNPRLGPERLLRDYLVQVDPSNPDLLLGKAYFAIGPWRLSSNFFIIERMAGPS